MKRTSSRKVRLGFHIVCYKDDREVAKSSLRIKSRVLDLIRHTPANKWYLKVTYIPDVYNDGDFTNQTDLINALNVWTEKDTLDYVEEGGW